LVFRSRPSEKEGTVRAKQGAVSLILAASCFLAIRLVWAAGDPEPGSSADTKPSITVIEESAVRGILGRAVQGADGKDIGRVVDVIVDPAGQVRAAIIDFGGFLGVGSRKIAVDWSALHFGRAVKDGADIRVELTRDQLKAAPEYKEGKTVVVIGSTGALAPLDFSPPTPPEK
jgi:sporulation protein YlmC with PRC-barrel domain